MMYPLVRELAAEDAPMRVSVAVTCRVLNLARQPYYRWLARPVTDAEFEQAYRANALFDAHHDDPEFGYRFLVDEARDAGVSMADRTAWRICRDNGWWSAFGKKARGKGRKPARRSTTTGSSGISPPSIRTSSGWPTSPSTRPARASSTCARSRTCSPTGSSGTPWTRG
jgi:putative transposase